jgi:hypothetical protein
LILMEPPCQFASIGGAWDRRAVSRSVPCVENWFNDDFSTG